MRSGVGASVVAVVLVACGARTQLDAISDDAATRDADARDTAPRDARVEAACGTVVTLQVPGDGPWFDTSVDVVAGERLRITASGVVRYGGDAKQVTDPNGGDYTGAQFFSTAVLPNTIICSLIGKVGGTTAVDTGTPLPEGTPGDGPGFVGTSYDEIVPESGRLFLGFNDQRQAFSDNSGAFTVTITLGC